MCLVKKGLIFMCLLAALILITGVQLTPCNAASKTEIVFWNLFGGGEGDFVDKIVKDFNDSQPDVDVKALRLTSNEYYAKFGVALASGKGPDVAICHIDHLAPFVKANQLTALEPVASKVGFKFTEVADNLAKQATFNSKYYAVPIDTHFHMLYYNKAILSKAGLLNSDGTPKLGTVSPEGFKKFLQEIKDKVPGVTPFPVNTPYFHEPFYNFYYEAGGDLLNANLTKAAINNQKAIKVLKYYMDLYDSKLSDINDTTPWQTFHDSKGAVWIGGVWEAGWHFGDNKDIAVIPLPAIFGGLAHFGSSHTLVIPAYVSKDKQIAAMKFMKYYIEIGGYTWGQAGHVPSGKVVAASKEYNSLPYRNYFVQAQKTVKFAPKTGKYDAVDTAIREQLQNIIFKKVTPEEGLKQAEQNINQILNQ
jgi:multiple sugar transport system substrate-binding protein